jgi:hypothetical protein
MKEHAHVRPVFGNETDFDHSKQYAIDSYDGRGGWVHTGYRDTKDEAQREAHRINKRGKES